MNTWYSVSRGGVGRDDTKYPWWVELLTCLCLMTHPSPGGVTTLNRLEEDLCRVFRERVDWEALVVRLVFDWRVEERWGRRGRSVSKQSTMGVHFRCETTTWDLRVVVSGERWASLVSRTYRVGVPEVQSEAWWRPPQDHEETPDFGHFRLTVKVRPLVSRDWGRHRGSSRSSNL